MVTASGRRLAVVIGDPIEHSLSPAIHNAAFAATDVDATFVTRRAGTADVAAVLADMRAERWLGMSVTMPDKEAVVAHLDALTPTAARLGAVNCVFWDGDRLVGDNTDGEGLVRAVRDLVGGDLAVRVGVLGAGGAARAAVLALAGAGAREIVIVNRTASRARAAVALAPEIARVGDGDELGALDLVVNATPAGMSGVAGGPATLLPLPGPGAYAMDLVYDPPETEWLAAARERGATVANGVPMLVGQAAVAFERWTGVVAPVEAMTAGAEAELAARRARGRAGD